MSELHKFIFDTLPVRGIALRLTDAWQDMLRCRAANTETGAYPAPVRALLGQMTAAGVLLQGSIAFNGALVLQILGDGPVKLAVAEVQPDFALRATATVTGAVGEDADLSGLVNLHGQGRCVLTLDPKGRLPDQQPYQGVVPLTGNHGAKLPGLPDVLEQYMRQSQQLDTTLVLAANDAVAAGLLIQRLPLAAQAEEDMGHNQDYDRLRILARSLTANELLELDVHTVLHRLFWQEPLRVFAPLAGHPDRRDAQGQVTETGSGPRFACACSRARVAQMIRNLGAVEAQSILAERENVQVGCDFCGAQYRFDPVDVAQLFIANP